MGLFFQRTRKGVYFVLVHLGLLEFDVTMFFYDLYREDASIRLGFSLTDGFS